MKVILNKDIQTVGRKYDIKDVADGYALNFLFPNNLAERATEKGLLRVVELQKARETEVKIQEELLHKNIDALKEVTITFEAKTNDKGHLFASIHKEAIVSELKKQAHVDMNPEFIVLDKPLKEAGEYEVAVKVRDAESHFKVVVSAL